MKNKRILTGARFRGISCRRGIFAKIVQNEAIFSLVSDFKKKTEEKFIFTLKNLLPLFALPRKNPLCIKEMTKNHFSAPLKSNSILVKSSNCD